MTATVTLESGVEIIDVYKRQDDTLDTTMVINAGKKAFKVAKPLIINSDQGSQFTSDKMCIRDSF